MKNNIIVVFSSHLGDVYDLKFKDHINNTIGCRHEVACYKNNNEFSLTEIYNKALMDYKSVTNSIFVFIHNDIVFKTRNWGKVLLNKFNNNPDYAIIGLAGTAQLNEDGVWWSDKSKLYGIVNHTDGIKEWESKFSPSFNGIKDVVSIDGVFISLDPEIITYNFDEKYKGFHYYDISFCAKNFISGCNIGVVSDIRILHKSIGITTNEWEENRKLFVEEYKEEFPIALEFDIHDIQNLKIKLNNEPKVSVIIPTKNNFDILYENIKSWKSFVKYSNYEIIIADTGSDDDVLEKYKIFDDNVKIVKYNYYNFAKINNDVVKNYCSNSEFILFCNDDIELLNDCLSRVVEVYQKNKNVGTVGIRLHYGDNSVQHNGIYVMLKDNDIHLSHIDLKKVDFYNTRGYYNSAGNTGAFLFIKKELFDLIGGFNENYIECFEDVELNLECINRNLKNITIFDAVAYHYESLSRNKNPDKIKNVHVDYETLIKYVTKQ